MNLSSAIMLVNEGIRPVKIEYDPDIFKNNNPNKLFKTLDTALKVGDLVIIPTNTRHKFTIGKVEEIDFPVDFNSPEQWGWIGGKFDKETYDQMLKIEDSVKHMVAKATENKMRAELKAAAGLGNVDFSEVQAALRPPSMAKAADVTPALIPPAPPQPTENPAPRYGKAPTFGSDPDDDDFPF